MQPAYSPCFGTRAASAPVAVFRPLDQLGADEVAKARLSKRDARRGCTGTSKSTAQAFVGGHHVVPLLGCPAVCCSADLNWVRRAQLHLPELLLLAGAHAHCVSSSSLRNDLGDSDIFRGKCPEALWLRCWCRGGRAGEGPGECLPSPTPPVDASTTPLLLPPAPVLETEEMRSRQTE